MCDYYSGFNGMFSKSGSNLPRDRVVPSRGAVLIDHNPKFHPRDKVRVNCGDSMREKAALAGGLYFPRINDLQPRGIRGVVGNSASH